MGPCPALALAGSWPSGHWVWRRSRKELVNPGLLCACWEANCWENPMTSKPPLSLRTQGKTEAKIKRQPEISLTAKTNSRRPGLVISKRLPEWRRGTVVSWVDGGELSMGGSCGSHGAA